MFTLGLQGLHLGFPLFRRHLFPIPELGGSDAGYFFELTVKMNLIGITAELCNLIDGEAAGEEGISGVIDAHPDQVAVEGDTKVLFI